MTLTYVSSNFRRDITVLIYPSLQHSSHQHGEAGDQTFELRGINCYSTNDKYDSTVTVTLKADTRQTVFIDIDKDDKMVAKVVSTMTSIFQPAHDVRTTLYRR